MQYPFLLPIGFAFFLTRALHVAAIEGRTTDYPSDKHNRLVRNKIALELESWARICSALVPVIYVLGLYALDTSTSRNYVNMMTGAHDEFQARVLEVTAALAIGVFTSTSLILLVSWFVNHKSDWAFPAWFAVLWATVVLPLMAPLG